MGQIHRFTERISSFVDIFDYLICVYTTAFECLYVGASWNSLTLNTFCIWTIQAYMCSLACFLRRDVVIVSLVFEMCAVIVQNHTWTLHKCFHQQEICNKRQYKSFRIMIGFRFIHLVDLGNKRQFSDCQKIFLTEHFFSKIQFMVLV